MGWQLIVYGFGEASPDTPDTDEILHPRTLHALQATELAQQLPALFRPQSRYLFERRRPPRFTASLPVPGNGKSMRLVTQLLDE
jgi:hypothetical protein